MSKTLTRLRAQLALIGATLDDDGYTLQCDAPSGYVWNANNECTIPIRYASNSQSWLVLAIKEDGMDRLRLGLHKVTNAADLAARRFELGDDSWGASSEAPETLEWPT